jgi:hypothetical protein
MKWNRGAASGGPSVITIRRGRGELGNAVAARRRKSRKRAFRLSIMLTYALRLRASARDFKKTLEEARRES